MYLKRLEIQGFKSFADKVEFEFPSGITAIVGPNGSGKSNVVDSIRWVLGEQSAKSLRGSKMDDVIFAGSSDRRAIGMAQVALTLDNSAGLFPLDYDEVTIARRLYRSGESEYLINKTACRLKDIHELFMDTGLGREGFSVISQGKVDEILSLKPEDRRGLIEEAAGIIKYKYRKKEAERKLEDTGENLVRINDIVSELAERVGPLGEQAEKAQNYQLWKNELDNLEISLEVDGLEKNLVQEKAFSAELLVNENELTGLITSHSRLDAEVVKAKAFLQQLDQEIAELQQDYFQTQSQMALNENEITLAGQIKTDLLEQQGKIAAEIRYYQDEVAKLIAEQAEKQAETAAVALVYQQEQQVVAKLAVGIKDKQAQKDQAELRLNDLKDASVVNMQDQARNHNEILRLEQELLTHDKRMVRIDEKAKRLQAEEQEIVLKLASVQKNHDQLEAQHLSQAQALQEAQLQIAKRQAVQKTMQQTLLQDQASYQQIVSRAHALKELEESGDGYQFGVKSILEQKKNNQLAGVVGTVAQLIKVPDYLEKAIETVMGAGLQNIVMDNDRDAQNAIAYLKKHQKGRATFLPLNTIKGRKADESFDSASVLGLAVDLIQFDSQYQQVMNYLLGRVWVVKDLASAVNLGKQKGFSQRLVTLDGDLITPGGALSGGNYAKQKGSLLGRQRQISELTQSAEQLQARIKAENVEIEEITQEIAQLTEQAEAAKERGQVDKLRLNELEQQMDQLIREKHRLSNDLAIEMMDLTDLSTETTHFKASLQNEKSNKVQIQKKKAVLEETLSGLKLENAQLAELLTLENASYNQHQIQLATGEQRYSLMQEQLTQLAERLEGAERQFKQKNQDAEGLRQKDEDQSVAINRNRAEIQQLTYQLQEKNQRLVTQRDQRTTTQEEIVLNEEKNKGIQKSIDQLKDQKYALDLNVSKVKVQIESGLKRLAQNFDCTFEEALAKKMAITDEKEMAKRAHKLKSMIQALGSINFTAVEEYQQVQDRLTFLTAQVDDLLQAKQSLNKVINDMEQIMAQKFKETYHIVNDTFSQVFTAMFGGGQARLELSYPQDYLLTGIEIIAQPPGKKEQILSLLSGGERAMTAIALLFALLTVKPSPFCILDEIEAALDDVNVDRFARFIREYTHKTQFIIISHRKGTMEAADALYGVAMENNGVSRLMSVKLSNYH